MALSLTPAAAAALNSHVKSPNLVLTIDGIGTIYSAGIAEKPVRFGDGSIFGDPETDKGAFYFGDSNAVADQENVILLQGTSTSIKQSLDPFKGQGTSVSTLSISLMDDGTITEMITPGSVVEDIMQRQAVVRLGFQGTAYPEDYVIVFRGFVTDITSDAGTVTFLLNGTDEKKRTNIYKQAEAKLTLAMTNVSTATIKLDSYDNFLQKILGPDGTYDPSFKAYVRIDDEIIGYETVDNGLLVISRAQLGSVAAAHDLGTSVTSYYRLTGNGMDLALKLMASGQNNGFSNTPVITNFLGQGFNVGGNDRVSNSLYFEGVDVNERLGLVVGDWMMAVGGGFNSSNQPFRKRITDIIQGETGAFVVLDGVNFVDEVTPTFVDFDSQYATLPDGCLMLPDEIDVLEHERIKRLFLSSDVFDFYLKDTIDSARDFIESQIYLPLSAYSLPRKARASVGYQIGPIPGQMIQTFDSTNIKNPKSIQVKRSTNSSFYNEVVYKYDRDALEDEFDSGFITISELSKGRIKNSPNRSLVIESEGLRSSLNAQAIVRDKSKRRLDRYQFGAEVFTFSSLLDAGFGVEIGDIIVFDGSDLMLPDIRTGQKGIAPRLLEVSNRDFQLKTGDLKFTAVDTNFDGTARYALMSPSSKVVTSDNAQEFTIGASFSKRFGTAEYRKWQSLIGAGVVIRNADFSVIGESSIMSVTQTNRIRLKNALGFTPVPGMIMELVKYQSPLNTPMLKVTYGWMSADDFADGSKPYQMI